MPMIPTSMCIAATDLDFWGRAPSVTVYDAATLVPLGESSGPVLEAGFEFMGVRFVARPASVAHGNVLSAWRVLDAVVEG
jgi:hypothetical protein